MMEGSVTYRNTSSRAPLLRVRLCQWKTPNDEIIPTIWSFQRRRGLSLCRRSLTPDTHSLLLERYYRVSPAAGC